MPGELAAAGEKVRVNVSLGGCDEPKTFISGEAHVAIDVTLGVDNERFARLLAARSFTARHDDKAI